VSERIKKVNSLIQRLFGEILQREADVPADVLITISAVETVPNLRSSTIWLYISPLERGEEVLSLLKSQLYDLQGELNRKLSMRPLPRITLKLDHGAQHASTIEKRLSELGHGISPDSGEASGG
jgi:Ribosome-binding factor A